MEHLVKMLEDEIRKFRFESKPRSLYDPIHYIMTLGGKRLRPMLTLMTTELYGRNPGDFVKYAVAVEAFHNFTLMHDDIMDQAPLRRGKPTVHMKWNVNTAILSGDVLLVKVYNQFLGLPETQRTEVLSLFNMCATRVCEGQQWDMEFETAKTVTESQYLQMIELKTAVLLGFSLELGGILADAPAKDRVILRSIGTNMGIAFQLKDDLLDVYGDKKKFGKQQGGDILSNKRTFLLVKALRQAKGKHASELKKWLSRKTFDKRKKIKAVTTLYDELSIREHTEKKINHYLELAGKEINQLTLKEGAKGLKTFLLELAKRQK
ncbi:MAG: polyprenyl synthetase family protein [Cyclobacteriaceae bacterium]|nr:polyprenyl synthetase family protein [Cyclobacteriaceae bacterium]